MPINQSQQISNGYSSFFTSFLTILVSQIGDKTFFIAMIMAMRYSYFLVFIGAYSALALMTILSAVFGNLIFSLLPKLYTDIIVTCLFLFFGFKMLYEAYNFQEGQQNQEMKEVEQQLNKIEQSSKKNNQQLLLNGKKQEPVKNKFILSKAFILTFLAEWGDRSQIATIALAGSFNVFIVCFGALLGHFLCTLAGVRVGQLISQHIKQKYVLYAGGLVFILSGIITFINICN